jgi:hypothetical protein
MYVIDVFIEDGILSLIFYSQQQQAAQQQAQHQQQLHQQQQQQAAQQQSSRIRREFRNKGLHDWSVIDSCDWLDSLFMPEYKGIFQQRGIDGKRLLRMDNAIRAWSQEIRSSDEY